MRIKINKDDFLKAIQLVYGIATTKTTLPILSNILIETKNNKLFLTTTDLDICISTTAAANVIEQGSITLPAKKLYDIIKELPNMEVDISVKKNNITIIECPNTVFKIMGLPKEDFPKVPDFKTKNSISMPQQMLKAMLDMTSFAVSRDESRYVLNGVLIVVKDNNMKIVATDGRRLALIERELAQAKGVNIKTIIPTKAVMEIAKLLSDEGDVGITFEENQVMFESGETRLITRVIEGDFPNYEQVIPKETKEKIRLDKDKLMAALRRANLLTNQDSQAIKMEVLKNRLVISKATPELGEVKEELEAEHKKSDILIGFNPGYLIDVLKNLPTTDVSIELTSPEKPGVIRVGNEYVYVVLPMQLS